jgi:hypothetical protein
VVDVVEEFVVVVTGMVVVVVVVGVVLAEQADGMVVVVVVASAGPSWADVVTAVVETTSALSTTEMSAQRRTQWSLRGVT